MSDIVWEDPPAAKGNSRKEGSVFRFVAELKQHPGKWAIYPHAATRQAGTNMRRRYAPNIEVTSRATAPGKVTIYVRWVGES